MAQDPVGPSTDGGGAPTIQKPSNVASQPENGRSGADNTTATSPTAGADAPSDAAAVPDAPGSAAGDSAPADGPANSEVTNASGVDANDAATSDAADADESSEIAPDLLAAEGGDSAETSGAAPVSRPQVSTPDTDSTAVRRDYSTPFRPSSNPAKLNIAVRALFANAGGKNRMGGRLGGAQVDVGQAWNSFGYGVTASAWGGRIYLPRETGAEMNALFGVGPTLSLGRRALVQRGFLDLRVGYDFFYGVVNERRDDPTVVQTQTQSTDDVNLVQADNLVPHGPRATLGIGLYSPNTRKFAHGVGMAIGYQGLVGSFRGELPFTHMLTLGLTYWMG